MLKHGKSVLNSLHTVHFCTYGSTSFNQEKMFLIKKMSHITIKNLFCIILKFVCMPYMGNDWYIGHRSIT